MNIQSVIVLSITTLAPVAIMGWYIYRKDQYKPEPLKALFITAFLGLIGGLVSYIITKVGLRLPEIYVMHEPAVTTAAILQVTKTLSIGDLIMMTILAGIIICNRFFDEQMDGIVYSVFIALGFILCQNIIYLFYKDRSLFDSDSLRALFLIPIYFIYSILSGYYVSRVCFRRPRWNWRLLYDLALFLLYPFLWHILLVTCLLASEMSLHILAELLFFVLLIHICFLTMSYALQRIESHLARDWKEGRAQNAHNP